VNEYEELANSIPPSGKGFLLHLGWGAGWHGMTIGRLLQDRQGFDFEGLRSKFDLGKRGVVEFPKTRKIIFKQNQPEYPIGWVKISLKE
jgi:CRISPR type III-A-associated RAMP protein Csm5